MRNAWKGIVRSGLFAWICLGLLVQSGLNLIALGITLVYDSLVVRILYTSSTAVQAIFVGLAMYFYLVATLRKPKV